MLLISGVKVMWIFSLRDLALLTFWNVRGESSSPMMQSPRQGTTVLVCISSSPAPFHLTVIFNSVKLSGNFRCSYDFPPSALQTEVPCTSSTSKLLPKDYKYIFSKNKRK